MAIQNGSDSEPVVSSNQPGLSGSSFFLDLQAVGVGTKTGLVAMCLESSSAKKGQMSSIHNWTNDGLPTQWQNE